MGGAQLSSPTRISATRLAGVFRGTSATCRRRSPSRRCRTSTLVVSHSHHDHLDLGPVKALSRQPVAVRAFVPLGQRPGSPSRASTRRRNGLVGTARLTGASETTSRRSRALYGQRAAPDRPACTRPVEGQRAAHRRVAAVAVVHGRRFFAEGSMVCRRISPTSPRASARGGLRHRSPIGAY